MAETVVGLMGFGRIGRNLVRILYERDDIRIVAISDTADPQALEYLLRFDTILGRFPDAGRASRTATSTSRGGRSAMLDGEKPGRRAVGRARRGRGGRGDRQAPHRAQELERHLEAGAKRVILCAPPRDPPDITVVMGVNDHRCAPSTASSPTPRARPTPRRRSCRSCGEAFGIERGFLSDGARLHQPAAARRRAGRGPAHRPRRRREHHPAATPTSAPMLDGAAARAGGRISGMAMNVPVPNGSVVDLVCWHARPVTVDAINEVVRTAAATPAGRASSTTRTGRSSRATSGSRPTPRTFDALATMVLGDRLSRPCPGSTTAGATPTAPWT